MGEGRFAGASAILACVLTSVAFGGVSACKKKAKGAEPVADAAPPAPHVPAPFTAIKIGMAAADLVTAFPAAEPTEKCKVQLVGGDAPLGPLPPATLNGAHARCARAQEVGGLAESEKKLIHERTASKRTESEAADFERAWVYTTAQIRGVVRAGQLDERAVFDAASGEAQTTAGAVTIVAGSLTTGSRVFSLPRNNGRPICACITDSCDDMDPDRVRRYVEGGFSLGQLDADAHSRVVNGKCRGTYLRNERALQRKFVVRTGGLAAIGLARAAQKDRALDPNKRSTFVTFSGRSKLDEATSKVGILLANSVFKAESYWTGTIALVPAPDAAQVWSAAVVWLQEGKVSRIMLNIADQAKLGELPKMLETDYGKPSASAGTVTSWQLPNGLSARLDSGAAMSLVVEPGSGVPAADGGAAHPPDQ